MEKANRQLSSTQDEQQTRSKELRNVQKKQERIGKEVYYHYYKGEQEENFFPPTNQGDEPIINSSQKVKEEEISDNQEPEYQDPRFVSELIY
ncbi:hypothetical protein O181_099387 [Austropuccinia psidii MF-1]|uniref:Uncharacterized protein n=1 Tax=Austropuccinia psidii MF-1 TaxID=1389203 RepID=A0A9Q3PGH0_9BASI|nr:hypothetical protein [Austropuccinia psidii MF-1]